jgi:hypothetical protein
MCDIYVFKALIKIHKWSQSNTRRTKKVCQIVPLYFTSRPNKSFKICMDLCIGQHYEFTALFIIKLSLKSSNKHLKIYIT